MVAIDFVGPLDTTRHGFEYIYSLVDMHISYAKMQALWSYDALTAIQVF